MRIPLFARTLVCCLLYSAAARAETYVVAPGGSDGASGSSADPWETLQHAADEVGPGDTVMIRPGTYPGFQVTTSGTGEAPIVFSGEAGTIIDGDNPSTSDGINVEDADWIVIQGFEVTGTSRAGIRAVLCEHVTIRGNDAHDNARWGIFTGFCDDLVIEGNSASGSLDEHGIYVSNSGDRPVIRGNRIFDNNANGIHMNGDASQGGDGIISGALVEANLIWGNGQAGGSGINCDGVVDSVIRNNVIYDTHASGISLYRIDGGAPSTGNLVAHNTVVVAADGRWAMNIQDGSADNTLLNNIFLNEHPSRGSIDACTGCIVGLVSDYNIVADRFSLDETFIDLADWGTQTGQDAHSVTADPTDVFESFATNDFRLASHSPARDAGTASAGVATDILGVPRPVGSAVDMGAYEYCEGDACTGGTDSDEVPDAGTPDATPPDAGDDGAGEDVPPDETATDSSRDGSTGDATADRRVGGADGSVEGGGTDESSCGCRSASSPASAAGWLLCLALVRRRRASAPSDGRPRGDFRHEPD